MCITIQDALNSLQEQLELRPQLQIPDNATFNIMNPTKTKNVRLPRINIEQFSSDLHKWSTFINLYDTLIHNSNDLSTIQKFHQLINNVTGSAKSVISHYT